MIPKANYHSRPVFEEEVAQLFGRGWQFVALRSELARDRDYVTVDHAGAAIVVQNFKGELHAFQNICSHRFNRIQLGERGNRMLLCGYHGWNFDKTGFPFGLPKRDQFLGKDNDRLCLTRYPVDTCGEFVFVDRGGGTVTLNEHLGGFGAVLEEMGGYLGPETQFAGVPHAANWKLLVENVLECYHCSTVHQETFVPWGVGKLPIDDARFDSGHSSAHFPRQDQPREELRLRYLSHLKERAFDHNSFFHIYVFPNLFVSSSQGLSFYVGQLLPEGPERTLLRMRNFEPRVDLSPKHRARQDPISADSNAMSLRLIEEDRAVLEQIQRGIHLADAPGAIGDDEIRIRDFHRHYAHAMAGGVEPVLQAAE
ncbi:MAG TPA: aromatic ring-hydroxylating dioxygenase subunit alpha [Sphingomonas sp.]|jgi:phenylpropionate dioxygenase-like ring-hydroxylating dioxygenase large terminal subunit|uniref:aromatic ring-hydroxylating oxygenase subunit alpha n=1 Tax=Sphingomonas sp. TaxID=28214 RepID=UPI002ED95F6A